MTVIPLHATKNGGMPAIYLRTFGTLMLSDEFPDKISAGIFVYSLWILIWEHRKDI